MEKSLYNKKGPKKGPIAYAIHLQESGLPYYTCFFNECQYF